MLIKKISKILIFVVFFLMLGIFGYKEYQINKYIESIKDLNTAIKEKEEDIDKLNKEISDYQSIIDNFDDDIEKKNNIWIAQNKKIEKYLK